MFEWDDNKRAATLRKHGIDFVRATTIFDNPHIILPARSELEERWIAVGPKLITVVFTMRGEITRIITARHARKSERQIYEAQDFGRNSPNGRPH